MVKCAHCGLDLLQARDIEGRGLLLDARHFDEGKRFDLWPQGGGLPVGVRTRGRGRGHRVHREVCSVLSENLELFPEDER